MLASVSFGTKLPSPRVDQLKEPVEEEPFREMVLEAQAVSGPVAFTWGVLVIVRVRESDTGLQLPLFVEVKVNVTLPAAVSEALGL